MEVRFWTTINPYLLPRPIETLTYALGSQSPIRENKKFLKSKHSLKPQKYSTSVFCTGRRPFSSLVSPGRSNHASPQVALERTSFSRGGLTDDFNLVGERGNRALANFSDLPRLTFITHLPFLPFHLIISHFFNCLCVIIS